MPLTQSAIDELKEIYKKEYGKELSNDEAWEMGHRLLRLFAVLIRKPPDHQDKHRPLY
jgi:hypothetical protein